MSSTLLSYNITVLHIKHVYLVQSKNLGQRYLTFVKSKNLKGVSRLTEKLKPNHTIVKEDETYTLSYKCNWKWQLTTHPIVERFNGQQWSSRGISNVANM